MVAHTSFSVHHLPYHTFSCVHMHLHDASSSVLLLRSCLHVRIHATMFPLIIQPLRAFHSCPGHAMSNSCRQSICNDSSVCCRPACAVPECTRRPPWSSGLCVGCAFHRTSTCTVAQCTSSVATLPWVCTCSGSLLVLLYLNACTPVSCSLGGPTTCGFESFPVSHRIVRNHKRCCLCVIRCFIPF